MKKLSVLLLAAVVALGAAAGNKLVNPQMTKVNIKEAKAMSMTKKMLVRGNGMKQNPTVLDNFTKDQRTRFMDNGEVIKWGFEDADEAAMWTTIDYDGDGYNWGYYTNSEDKMTPYDGDGLMASASYVNDGEGGGVAVTPDNWLISPQVILNGKLGFYAKGQDSSWAAEVFAVYVCVGTPEGVESFVKISEDITATGEYKQYVFDLSAYEGMEGCIAIRHYNVTDQFMLNIDDVMIGDFEEDPAEPEPETPTVITEIPEGCQVYTYYRNSGCLYSSWFYGIVGSPTDGKISVAFDLTNGDVYIQNPAWYHDGYGTWVKGTYDWMTGIISIPTGQYLSWNASYQYGIQLVWGSSYVYMDTDPDTGEEGYYVGYEIDERTTEIQFMIDDDCIYLLGTSGDIYAEFPDWANTEGMMTIWSDDLSWTSIEFANRDEYGYAEPFGQLVNLVPAVPADPTADEWYDCGDESGYSLFYFTLPTTDVDGNKIDPEYLSYSIFVDNGNGAELFTFPAEDYTFDLYEDITEVDYALYSSAVDFHNYYLYFYRTNAEGYEPLFTENIGIQVYYTVDGVRNASNIVWLYDPASGVDEVNAAKTVANVRYFNVAGQEMAQPEGLTIKVTTYTDGTTSAVKVVK